MSLPRVCVGGILLARGVVRSLLVTGTVLESTAGMCFGDAVRYIHIVMSKMLIDTYPEAVSIIRFICNFASFFLDIFVNNLMYMSRSFSTYVLIFTSMYTEYSFHIYCTMDPCALLLFLPSQLLIVQFLPPKQFHRYLQGHLSSNIAFLLKVSSAIKFSLLNFS